MDMQRQEHGPEDEADGAERAFEALREEVAALRRGIDLVYRQAQQAGQAPAVPEAPDYSPTLGVIAQELRAVGTRLDGIEGQPALRATPAAQAAELRAQLHQAGEDARRGFAHAQGRMDEALHELRSLIGSANSQFVQQRREWVAVAIGIVLGFVVWYPLVWLTPFGGGHWLAASLIGGGRWQAGETLMQEAAPAAWERMVRLYRACPQDSTAELCETALAVRTITPRQGGTAVKPDVATQRLPPERGR